MALYVVSFAFFTIFARLLHCYFHMMFYKLPLYAISAQHVQLAPHFTILFAICFRAAQLMGN